MKITRLTCGNGEGMFEDEKGYYISFEDHKEALKSALQEAKQKIETEIDKKPLEEWDRGYNSGIKVSCEYITSILNKLTNQ